MKIFKKLLRNIFLINFIVLVFWGDSLKASNKTHQELDNKIEKSYIIPKQKDDYILDTGDLLIIKFLYAKNFNGSFYVNKDGEIYLPRINYAYVRGLTTTELKVILEDKYKEFLVNPSLEIRIGAYKPVRIFVKGEVRSPGVYKLKIVNIDNESLLQKSDFPELLEDDNFSRISDINNVSTNPGNLNTNAVLSGINIKGANEYTVNLSNALFKAGGITKYSDIKNIEIIRDVPIGSGGGKKKTIIDFTSFIENYDSTYDIRLNDGDTINVPRLSSPNLELISKGVLTRISPKYITIQVLGRIADTGTKTIPIDGTLSDVMDLYGPMKPLSGKVVLLRYRNDGKYIKKKISYKRSAPRGSSTNPYLKESDIISVTDSFFGRSTKVLKEFTDPFLGIFTTKEVLEEITQ